MIEKQAAPARQPRHVVFAVKHLLTQREKAINIRDKADAEVKALTASLEALGWSDELADPASTPKK